MRLILPIAILLLSMVACTKKKSNEYNLDIRETLQVNFETEPPTLDNNKATDTTSSWIMLNTMEGLVGYDYSSKDLSAIPALAESWQPTEKNKVWTFKLRKNVLWSDGVELKAQHFLDSWE